MNCVQPNKGENVEEKWKSLFYGPRSGPDAERETENRNNQQVQNTADFDFFENKQTFFRKKFKTSRR